MSGSEEKRPESEEETAGRLLLEAADAALVDEDGLTCVGCGLSLRDQSECKMRYGEDPYGQSMFCPECEYCCGC